MIEKANKLFGSSSARSAFPSSRPAHDSSLRIRAPGLFTELVHRYGAVLDEAVEQRIHQGEPLSTELSDLSAWLRRLRASARDVIELHARALDEKLASTPQRLTGAYLEEGRFVVLELMGRLLSDYRAGFLQSAQQSGQGCSSIPSLGAHRRNEE